MAVGVLNCWHITGHLAQGDGLDFCSWHFEASIGSKIT